jgi:hypothetical protein
MSTHLLEQLADSIVRDSRSQLRRGTPAELVDHYAGILTDETRAQLTEHVMRRLSRGRQREQLIAARAAAAAAVRAAERLEAALREDPKRHDPVFIAAHDVRENTEAAVSTYSDWLNQR